MNKLFRINIKGSRWTEAPKATRGGEGTLTNIIFYYFLFGAIKYEGESIFFQSAANKLFIFVLTVVLGVVKNGLFRLGERRPPCLSGHLVFNDVFTHRVQIKRAANVLMRTHANNEKKITHQKVIGYKLDNSPIIYIPGRIQSSRRQIYGKII